MLGLSGFGQGNFEMFIIYQGGIVGAEL